MSFRWKIIYSTNHNKPNHHIPMKLNFSYRTTLLFLFALFPTFAWTQTAYEISGIVTDSTTHDGIPGIVVTVRGTGNGAVTNDSGAFHFKTQAALPFTIVVQGAGYHRKELTVSDGKTSLNIALNSENLLVNEVVVSASRVEENALQTPVTIDKIDIRAIRDAPQSSFFDALETVRGVQFTTLSIGFKVPNTRGFSGTTNARFLQLVDGADNQAPGLGVSIANAVGPTELDILSVELIPGAASALYGMNALNGLSSIKTRNPFVHQGVGFYQKTGVNHADGADHQPSLFTETAFRVGGALNNRFAFKINGGYTRGYDWIANDSTDINALANASQHLYGSDNPGYDGINSYGNESSNRKTLTLGGKKYVVSRTGYNEQDITDYGIENKKFDAGIYFRPSAGYELSYSYRIGTADNIYQRGNRIRLDDYLVQQHKVEFSGPQFIVRAYYTQENTGKSYNLRPLGENLDRAYKSDATWFADYTAAWNNAIAQGNSIAESHHIARTEADSGRYIPGTPEFEAKRQELIGINNWDKGAALVMKNSLLHAEGQYAFSDSTWLHGVLVGADHRTYFIYPDGNSFINPIDSGKTFTFQKYGAFVQYTKSVLSNKLKFIASARVDKATYFNPVFNPRLAVVYTLSQKHNFRLSVQNGYRYPTLFEGFSYVDNGGVRRIGGLAIMSQNDQLFENSYTRTSVDAFSAAVTSDINAGYTQADAIARNTGKLVKSQYTYIKPEHINSIEIGYKALLWNDHVFIDADAYYNSYTDFIGQVEIVKPNNGTIGVDDSTAWFAYDRSKNKRYRMWTNSLSTVYNHGASLAVSVLLPRNYVISTNISYSAISKTNDGDALIPAFNTPRYIVNFTAGNRSIVKNVGASVSWRWQDGFYWQSPLADGYIPAYQTTDIQITLKLPKISSTLKFGATNLLNNRFAQYTGGPNIGGFYYTTFIYEGLSEGLFNKSENK